MSFVPLLSSAQVPDEQNPEQVLPDQFDSNDSLNVMDNNDVTIADSLTGAKISFDDVDVPTFEDSMYASRLKAIPTVIPLAYNDEVRNYIDLYVLKRRGQVERMLGLGQFYFPIFDQIFAQYGIPPEIKNLAIIESALNPQAVSRAGAVGMWQFMYGTAKLYGLTVNNYYDDRRDIIRSTEGAAQYLRNMYDVYGDWLLAIASYNCGPQNVNRAIAKSGGNTFWAIKDYLPKETRGYVPAFIAATYVMNYYDLHDLSPDYDVLKHCWDSIAVVNINDKMSCEEIARFTDMSVDEVRFLNPGLRCSVIPVLDVPYGFKLPSDKTQLFDQYRDSIILLSVDANQHARIRCGVHDPVGGAEPVQIAAEPEATAVAKLRKNLLPDIARIKGARAVGIAGDPGERTFGLDCHQIPNRWDTMRQVWAKTLRASPSTNRIFG
jgi:membrane-bound lytic murein transglycosylase D